MTGLAVAVPGAGLVALDHFYWSIKAGALAEDDFARMEGVQSMKIPNVRLRSVQPLATGTLQLTWDDGVSRNVDVTGWMQRHPLLKMLNDPDIFRDVSLVNNGGGVEWANGADFCAQALRLLSDEQIEPKSRLTA